MIDGQQDPGTSPVRRLLPIARHKNADAQPRFLAISLARQLQSGTFEYALNHFLDHELDSSRFDARFCNDTHKQKKWWIYPVTVIELDPVPFEMSQALNYSGAVDSPK